MGSKTLPPRDLSQRPDDLVHVGDPLLQQVAEPGRPVLEQFVDVELVGVLGQHDDARGRVFGSDLFSRPDPFVRAGRGHADVGEHGVGRLAGDGRHEFLVGGRGADDLDVARLMQEGHCPFPNEVVILREHDPQHARMVHGEQQAI